MSFLAALRGNLSRLHVFAGREPRRSFWLYVLAVMSVLVVTAGVGMTLMMRRMSAKIAAIAAAHPGDVTVEQGPGHSSLRIHGNHPELMPDLTFALTVWAAVAAIVVLLLAAAVVRRLHDRDNSGAWGPMPLPFLFFGLFAMRKAFAPLPGGEPDLGWFLVVFANNLIYLASLVALVVLLCRRSTPGPNRYGPPVRLDG